MDSGEWALVLAIVPSGVSLFALAQSIRSARAAEGSLAEAKRSSQAAQRSATAAEQSRDLAAEALDLQRKEVTAIQQVRESARKTRLVALYWQRSARANQLRGLVLENGGPGNARDIRAVSNAGSGTSFVAREWPFLAAGGRVGLLASTRATAAETEGAPQTHGDMEFVVRIWWTNDDGTSDQSDWMVIRG